MAVEIWLIFSEFMQTFLVIYWKSHIQPLNYSNSNHLGLSGNLDPQMQTNLLWLSESNGLCNMPFLIEALNSHHRIKMIEDQ